MMKARSDILTSIWVKHFKEWDILYGKLTESLASHYSHNGATEIMLNAKGRKIDTRIIDSRMDYKFEDEPDELYRGSIERISAEELEKILNKST